MNENCELDSKFDSDKKPRVRYFFILYFIFLYVLFYYILFIILLSSVARDNSHEANAITISDRQYQQSKSRSYLPRRILC